ncbi:HNH endonuclease family protein [Frondihabitans australicus]|uniref:HNH endonuclease family protein n=1 Tax=Frondihabitans australicus TaxID=386892 RepID=UPI001FE61A37|nr:HNH endonuclease family protein [Frondihabitans australicus]
MILRVQALRSPGRRVLAAAVVCALLGAGGGCAAQGPGTGEGGASGGGAGAGSPAPAPSLTSYPAGLPSAETGAAARAQLAALPVKPLAPRAGYDRKRDFGEAWADVDRNGCDTRNDILARDLVDVVRARNCKVESGVLSSPFSGTTIRFTKGDLTSPDVQIDHVVALADAWRTGAQALSKRQRLLLANDPVELLAVDAASNDDKGSQDAAHWLPRNVAFRCTYATLQVEVKAKYRLWVTTAEGAALRRVLAGCP